MDESISKLGIGSVQCKWHQKMIFSIFHLYTAGFRHNQLKQTSLMHYCHCCLENPTHVNICNLFPYNDQDQQFSEKIPRRRSAIFYPYIFRLLLAPSATQFSKAPSHYPLILKIKNSSCVEVSIALGLEQSVKVMKTSFLFVAAQLDCFKSSQFWFNKVSNIIKPTFEIIALVVTFHHPLSYEPKVSNFISNLRPVRHETCPIQEWWVHVI